MVRRSWSRDDLRRLAPAEPERPVTATSAVQGVLLGLDGDGEAPQMAWARLSREKPDAPLTHKQYIELIGGKNRPDGPRTLLAEHAEAGARLSKPLQHNRRNYEPRGAATGRRRRRISIRGRRLVVDQQPLVAGMAHFRLS